jgi:hypothetical protein
MSGSVLGCSSCVTTVLDTNAAPMVDSKAKAGGGRIV